MFAAHSSCGCCCCCCNHAADAARAAANESYDDACALTESSMCVRHSSTARRYRGHRYTQQYKGKKPRWQAFFDGQLRATWLIRSENKTESFKPQSLLDSKHDTSAILGWNLYEYSGWLLLLLLQRVAAVTAVGNEITPLRNRTSKDEEETGQGL